MKLEMPPIYLDDTRRNRIRRAVHWPVLLGAVLLVAVWLSLAGYVLARVEEGRAAKALSAVGPSTAMMLRPAPVATAVPVEAAPQSDRGAMAARGTIAEPAAAIVVDPAVSVDDGTGAKELQIEIDRTLAARPVEFRYMQFQLRNDSRRVLLALGERLAAEEFPFAVRVRVHASSWGSARSNLEVSAERAQVVRDLLVSAGLPAGRVSAEGVGEAEPLRGRNEDETRRLNRRTEIRIVRE